MKDATASVRKAVRDTYAEIARGERSTCGTSADEGCCGQGAESRSSVPEGADLGLGCGNPTALAELRPGETVLDLGSGAGVDCFLAAERVHPGGRVIGVDMTPEMVERARENARKAGSTNVEFRLGEIESLPVADASVDVVISNCVVNLSPEKDRVFREMHRVLRPGGRVMIFDIVAVAEIPREVREDLSAYAGCVSGAVTPEAAEAMLREAGFSDVGVDVTSAGECGEAAFVRSASLRARKGRQDPGAR